MFNFTLPKIIRKSRSDTTSIMDTIYDFMWRKGDSPLLNELDHEAIKEDALKSCGTNVDSGEISFIMTRENNSVLPESLPTDKGIKRRRCMIDDDEEEDVYFNKDINCIWRDGLKELLKETGQQQLVHVFMCYGTFKTNNSAQKNMAALKAEMTKLFTVLKDGKKAGKTAIGSSGKEMVLLCDTDEYVTAKTLVEMKKKIKVGVLGAVIINQDYISSEDCPLPTGLVYHKFGMTNTSTTSTQTDDVVMEPVYQQPPSPDHDYVLANPQSDDDYNLINAEDVGSPTTSEEVEDMGAECLMDYIVDSPAEDLCLDSYEPIFILHDSESEDILQGDFVLDEALDVRDEELFKQLDKGGLFIDTEEESDTEEDVSLASTEPNLFI